MMKLFWRLCVARAARCCAGAAASRCGDGGNACHKPQPYHDGAQRPPLKIPAGLDAPDTTSALRLPALNEPAPPPRERQGAVSRRAAALQGGQAPRRPEAYAARRLGCGVGAHALSFAAR